MSHIGILAYALERSPSGIGRYTLELLASLKRLGLEPLVLHAGRARDGSGEISLHAAGLLPALLTIGQAEIAWVAYRKDLTLIHDPTGSMPLSLTGTRRISTVHDVVPCLYPENSTTLDRFIYRYWLPRIAPRLDALITDSYHSQADISRLFDMKKDQITVIPLAAGEQFQLLSRQEVASVLARYAIDYHYILYVGSVEPRKNLLRLVEAYTRLREWSAKWHLVIVGARNLWKSSPVRELVDRLDLGSCVHFMGYLPDEDLPAFYNGADLFAFPSLYEGFGLPVLEAMACGTPVVTSNTSSLPEVAGEAALLMDPYDIDAIRAAMQRILSDQDIAQDLCAKGLSRAAEFTWERTARETIAVYERILGESLD